MAKANCSISDCPHGAKCKGLCSTHYGRLWKYGDPLHGGPIKPREANTEETFWRRVSKNGPPILSRPDLGPCWPWTGTKLNSGGYASFGYRGKAREGAHRASWMMANGRDLEPGEEIDHLCHTFDPDCRGGSACPHRRCVNPDHLEPVTHPVNARRGVRGNMAACRDGHELQVLTMRNGHPKRYCPICAKKRSGELRDACVAGTTGRARRTPPTAELLASVAAIYLGAVAAGERPRVAVAVHFRRGPASVSPWIAKARRAGYLPDARSPI